MVYRLTLRYHTKPGDSDKEMLSYEWIDGWADRYMDGDDNHNILGAFLACGR